MPKRAGAKLVDHALTYFTHVRLPASALLGSTSKPADPRLTFQSVIWRVHVGSLSLSLFAIPTLAISAYIAGRYSLRRTVTAAPPASGQVPIWTFRTQQLPILHALAQVAVMRAHAAEAIKLYTDIEGKGKDARIRAAVAACVKTINMQQIQTSAFALSERCGALGLFEENQIIATQVREYSAERSVILIISPL